jgi:hypothetical protein
MSLDAIIPGQPHSADNIQWVCLRVNLGKWLWSDAEFRVWAKAAFTWSGRPGSIQDIDSNRNDNEDTEDEWEEHEEDEWEEAEAEEEWEEAEAEEEWEEAEEAAAVYACGRQF